MLLLALALVAPPPAPLAPGSNTRFSCSRRTTAPAARIWAIWTDVSRWHEWDAALKSAELNGPFAAGTPGRLLPQSGPPAPFALTAVEPGRSYTFRTKLPLGALYVKRTLGEADGQTLFTHEVWFAGFSKPVFGLLLGKKYRTLLPPVLAAIKTQAEP